MKQRVFLFLVLGSLLIVGCNKNPAWTGPEPKDKADAFAFETCKCLHEMVGKQPGWDVEKLMDEVRSIQKKTKGNLQNAVLESENPDILKALEGEEDFSMMIDDCECMKPIQDGLLEQGVPFETMMEKLDMNCLLGAFYN
jgi:hypothetical protein